MNLTLGVVTIAALVDSINPCAISVLLLTIGFLISLDKMRNYIIKIGLVYILGIFLTYFLIGIGALRALSIFGFPHILAQVGAIILAITAIINIANLYIPNFPIKLKIPAAAHPKLAQYIQKTTIPSFLILGILVGLFEFPCTGGPYLLILGLLHDRATQLQGIAYLAYYNFIFVAPLIITLVLASRPGLLAKVDEWRKRNSRRADLVTSVIMLILSGVIFISS